jgi:ATP-dependent RNA helicase DeaD
LLNLRAPSPIVPSDRDLPTGNDVTFADLNLSAPVLAALADVGYESPSPIQAATIPPLLNGKDVLGQAQTGTGKTAAFALPILSNLDLRQKNPQALVLCPTRELAIQVAEAFQKYAAHMPGFHLRRPKLYAATDEFEARCSRGCGYARSRHGSLKAQHVGLEQAHQSGARRSR